MGRGSGRIKSPEAMKGLSAKRHPLLRIEERLYA